MLRNILYKAIDVIFYGLIFAILAVLLIVDRYNTDYFYNTVPLPNIILIFASLFLVILMVYGLKKIEFRWNPKKIMLALSAILLVVEVVIVYNIFLYIDWDVRFIRDGANFYIAGVKDAFTEDYFKMNPNNVMLLSFTILAERIGTLLGINGYKIVILTAIIITNLSVLLTGIVTYEVSQNDKLSLICYGFAAVLVGLSPWMMVPYSDTFSLILPIGEIYLYVKYKKATTRPRKMALFLLMAFGALFMYLIKPTNIIILLAIIIYEIIETNRCNYKKWLGIVGGIIIAAVLAYGLQAAVWNALGYESDPNREKPVSHYLMIGANYESVGQYTNEDHLYSDSFDGKSLKTEMNIRKIKERLNYMGPVGYARHMIKKTDLNFNSGIFGWGKEIGFYSSIPDKDGALATFFRNIYYVDGPCVLWNNFGCYGEKFGLLVLVEQFMWLTILFMCSLTMVVRDNRLAIMKMAIVGMILFVSLFETNARYIYSYVPVFILLAGMSLPRLVGRSNGENNK